MVHAQLAFPFCFRSVCLHIRFSHALNVLFFLLQRLVLHCSTLTSNLCCVVLSSILGSQFWCRVSVHRFDMGKRNVKSLKFNPFPDPKKGTGRKVLKRPAKKRATAGKVSLMCGRRMPSRNSAWIRQLGNASSRTS